MMTRRHGARDEMADARELVWDENPKVRRTENGDVEVPNYI